MKKELRRSCRIRITTSVGLLTGFKVIHWNAGEPQMVSPSFLKKNLESIICSSVSCFLNGRTLFLDEGKKKYTLRPTLRPLVSVTIGSRVA